MFAAVWSTALIPSAALALLVLLLVRRGTTQTIALAALIACSPWTFDPLFRYRTPDQFGLAFLIASGLVLWRTSGRARTAWLAVLGLLGAVLTLVHEATMAVWGIFALLLIVQTPASVASRLRAVILVYSPGLFAMASVMAFGRSDGDLVSLLRGQPTTAVFLDQQFVGTPGYGGVLAHMGDSIADSLALVHSISPLRAILMLSWGLMLLLIHYSWLKGASPSFLRALRPLDELPRAWIVWASWAISGAAVLFVFATGVDWIRWFCSAGTSILVIGALLLLRHPNSGDRTWTGDFSPALVAIGVYFATRPVLPPMGTDSIKGLLDWWL